MTQTEVLRALTEWKDGDSKILRLENRLSAFSYRLTPTLSHTGGGGSGFRSKVEDYCMDRVELQKELDSIHRQRAIMLRAINGCGLTELQRGAVMCLIRNTPLSRYAKEHGESPGKVYKEKDKAGKQIAVFLSKNSKITRFEW